MPEVIEVNRKDGEVITVSVDVGDVVVSFCWPGEGLCDAGRKRSNEKGSLYISPADFKEAQGMAYAIFKEKK